MFPDSIIHTKYFQIMMIELKKTDLSFLATLFRLQNNPMVTGFFCNLKVVYKRILKALSVY